MALQPYATTGQRIWYYAFRVLCGLILFFLIFPIIIIIPLSFNALPYFTFTPGMLALEADAYSLCSIAGDLHVTQVVDVNKGVHCILPKAVLP